MLAAGNRQYAKGPVVRDKRTGERARWAVLRLAVMAILVVTYADVSAGTRVGNFCYRGTPELLDGRTIDVSDTMVALSNVFWAQTRRDTTVITSEPPSIFLAIDNSGSMQTIPGNDRSGSRFTIASAFVDSIQAKYPNAEMGLAVFGTYLYFDPADRPYFIACSTQVKGAYVPLLQLDSAYSAYGGQTGYQILKSLLAVSTYDTGVNQYVGLTYQPTDTVLRGPGCNLTAGFGAVKCAMVSARVSRCGQYVILFSDGEANAPGGDTTWYFRDSVKNVPTTFTAFFPVSATLQNSPGLRNIDTMTRKIQVNGYDSSYPPDSGCTTRSNYFAGNSATLMSTLISEVWEIIKTPNRAAPTLVVVNGSASFTRLLGDTAFLFSNFIPLIRDTTPVSVQVVYSIFQNNFKVRDTLVQINYNVHTLPHLNDAWNPGKDSFNIQTWDRNFIFRYNNNPIQFIADTMDSVELYFTFDSGTAHYGYDNLYIDLYNKIASVDSLSIQLSRVSDRVFSGKFKRQVSATANRFDALLQYRGTNDSIIAVFRNRENLTTGKVRLPLDTLRVAIPLSPSSAVFHEGSPMPRVGETWKVYSDNGRVRIRLPAQGAYNIKIYSLAGHLIDSRATSTVEESFRLPTGVYIVSVGQAGSRQEIRKRVIAIGR
jgi:hypothetical protein